MILTRSVFNESHTRARSCTYAQHLVFQSCLIILFVVFVFLLCVFISGRLIDLSLNYLISPGYTSTHTSPWWWCMQGCLSRTEEGGMCPVLWEIVSCTNPVITIYKNCTPLHLEADTEWLRRIHKRKGMCFYYMWSWIWWKKNKNTKNMQNKTRTLWNYVPLLLDRKHWENMSVENALRRDLNRIPLQPGLSCSKWRLLPNGIVSYLHHHERSTRLSISLPAALALWRKLARSTLQQTWISRH